MPGTEDILRTLLEQWKAGIDAHDPGRVAAVFTEDAIFQGLHPHTTNRRGVYDYYDSQPIGLRVDYRFHETRRLSDDVALAYLRTDFTRPDGALLPLELGLIASRNAGGQWLIAFYQVSAVMD